MRFHPQKLPVYIGMVDDRNGGGLLVLAYRIAGPRAL
jgi:hypothetical protein